MPRGFLVKRSRRPTPISYRTRCCCPAAVAERGDPALLLVPPPQPPTSGFASEPPELVPPAVPQFGTPEGPSAAASSPATLHSPARAVSEERSLHLGSPVSAESFPAPDPLLLGPGGELKLWAVAAAAAAIATGQPQPVPPRSHGQSQGASKRPQGRKAKAARKLHFEDEVTTSPVLGLRIKEGPPEPASTPQQQQQQQQQAGSAGGARAGGAQPLGEFICQLCKERYPDPLALAQHKCSRIVRVEYRCPECDKLFSCPANLASHRRWHKPRPPNGPAAAKAKAVVDEPTKGGSGGSGSERDTPSPGSGGGGEPEAGSGAEEFACPRCAKRFRRQSALRKHLPVHHEPSDGLPQQPQEGCPEEVAAGHSPLSLPGECHSCPVCGETFPSKSSQERHLRLLHAAQAFPCKYCPATFYSSPGLTRHINKCHPSENRQVILLQVPVRPAC
ncbi:insulinoma-associated protein 1 [Hemicordylus capensis]|uniref:insulinoma-associated protein 1 n=1 Tax=Hemicordylus capensis TaxID=884348 RepID=UPI0023029386|nr:insulinoma-associated protein 1 [Hemicordylus capensis]